MSNLDQAFSLFRTKRSELLELYKKNGVPFLATTRGLHSCRSLRFDAVGLDAAGLSGFLIARSGQVLQFFNYGQNDSIQLAGDLQHRANEADTSLTKGSRTPASNDLSIEWISMHPRALKVAYTTPTPVPDWIAANADPVLVRAFNGQVAMADAFGRVIPVDAASSALLEHALYQLAAPMLTARIEWDNADRTEKMGTCDQFTQGGGASYLHSNGEPSVNNRFRIPEGLLWAREGQPAGELIVNVRLEDDLVVPIAQVPGALSAAFTNPLSAVYLEVVMRLGGMALRVPGSN
jgi:hypothetical protein